MFGRSRYLAAASGLVALAIFVSGGCRPAPPVAPPAVATAIPVSKPVQRLVTEYVEYTGRTDAVDTIGIKARATGFLIPVKPPFVEGSEVKKGDLLFEIDPRPYQVQLDQAESQAQVAKVQADLARSNYTRLEKAGPAVSQLELSQAKATLDAADSQLKSAKSAAEVYRLNLGYTKVTSPIDGQVSRFYYAVGNLVSQDQTLLTTVVSTDPMDAYFDMDERTLIRIRTAINAGRVAPMSGAGGTSDLPVYMGLEGEDGFPHKGTINFINNAVSPGTGTIAVRGRFPNPKPAGGQRLLSPGMFVRIRFPLGQARPSVLVVDRAIGSDQGLKFVYVIDAEKKVKYRRVKTGPLEDDGLRVIEDGLKPDEIVAVGAIQQLRPGATVETEEVAMPTPGNPPPEPAPVAKPDPKKK